MQTLEVTDEQYAFIQHLREEISADVVGKYGFVREQDAIQFLIDNLDEAVDVDGEFESSATDDVAASVGAAIDGDPDPAQFEEVSYDERADPEATDDDSDESSTEDDAGIDGESDDASTSDASGDGGSDTGDTDDGDAEADDENGDADDDEMLDEMMSLLETHDDKWEESSSSDHRYTVTLPDGSTEDVQTKDDVRALLFKNYR